MRRASPAATIALVPLRSPRPVARSSATCQLCRSRWPELHAHEATHSLSDSRMAVFCSQNTKMMRLASVALYLGGGAAQTFDWSSTNCACPSNGNPEMRCGDGNPPSQMSTDGMPCSDDNPPALVCL